MFKKLVTIANSSNPIEPSLSNSLLSASQQNFLKCVSIHYLHSLNPSFSPSFYSHQSFILPATDCSCWGHWQVACCPRIMYLPSCYPNSQNFQRGDQAPILQAFSLWVSMTPRFLHSPSVLLPVSFLCHMQLFLVQFLTLYASEFNLSSLHFAPGLNTSKVLETQELPVRIHTANNQKSNSVLSNKGGSLAYITDKSRSKVVFRAQRCHQGTSFFPSLCPAFHITSFFLQPLSLMLTKRQPHLRLESYKSWCPKWEKLIYSSFLSALRKYFFLEDPRKWYCTCPICPNFSHNYFWFSSFGLGNTMYRVT